jgi:hypothetical protein
MFDALLFVANVYAIFNSSHSLPVIGKKVGSRFGPTVVEGKIVGFWTTFEWELSTDLPSNSLSSFRMTPTQTGHDRKKVIPKKPLKITSFTEK